VRAVEDSPREPIYLRELVRWQAKAGRVGEARATAARIVALDPLDAEAVANLGALEMELGDLPSARAHLRRAVGMADPALAVTVSVRLVRALLAPPSDAAGVAEAEVLARGLVRLTGGGDPIALVLLARAQAASGDADGARRSIASADILLGKSPPEVCEAVAADRAAAAGLIPGG